MNMVCFKHSFGWYKSQIQNLLTKKNITQDEAKSFQPWWPSPNLKPKQKESCFPSIQFFWAEKTWRTVSPVTIWQWRLGDSHHRWATLKVGFIVMTVESNSNSTVSLMVHCSSWDGRNVAGPAGCILLKYRVKVGDPNIKNSKNGYSPTTRNASPGKRPVTYPLVQHWKNQIS